MNSAEQDDPKPDDPGGDESTAAQNPTAGSAIAAGALAAAITVTAAPVAAQAVTGASAEAAPPTGAVTKSAKADGPGAAQLAQLCGDSTSGICRTPEWSEAHLTFDAVVVGRYVTTTWPEIKTVGGWRPSDPYPDHPSGHAVDIMMPNGGTGSDKKLGDEVSRYLQDHAEEFGIEYMLWHQGSWTTGTKPGKWKPMADRGSPTANHVDHVHITVKGDKGSIADELVAAATGAATESASVDAVDGDTSTPRLPVDPETTRTIVVELFDKN